MIRPSDLGLGQRFLALVSLATALGTAPLVFGQNANVTTQHNDNSRTGAYLFEKTLTPAAVKSRQMRVRWTHPVDGAIATQPLYVEDTFAGDAFAAILIGTTPNNSVYALDADTGAEIWHKALADSNPALRPLPRGINSTPVIDVCSHRIYLLFSTKNQVVDAAG